MAKSDALLAKLLVNDTGWYSDILPYYSSEFDCYRALRNAAPHELSEYEEYLELHRIFLERETTDKISEFVSENLARSIKNMVTGESPRGQAYPVNTLVDVSERLEAYRDLGVDTPSIETTVETIIEHLLDHGEWETSSHILKNLLQEVPEGMRDSYAVDLLARLHMGLNLCNGGDPEVVIQDYIEATDPFCADGPETAEACLDKADSLSYGDRKKIKLYQTAIHRNPSYTVGLSKYLYQSAVDDLEHYRHGDVDPSRAVVAVAGLLLDALEESNLANQVAETASGDEQRAWMQSYQALADAVRLSSRRWNSLREVSPDPEFEDAAVAYLMAASYLRSVSSKRSLTYLSKAFRMWGHAASHSENKYRRHDEASRVLLEWADSPSNSQQTTTRLQSLLKHHMFEKKRAQFDIHFNNGQYEDAVDRYDECSELSESVNSPVNLERERMLAYLAEGRLADNRNEYEESYGYYVNAETLVTSQKNKERIQSRMAFCRAKQQVSQSNVAKADSIVQNEMHGHYPVLRGALAVLQGGRLRGPDAQDEGIIIDDPLITNSSTVDDEYDLTTISEQSLSWLTFLLTEFENERDSGDSWFQNLVRGGFLAI